MDVVYPGSSLLVPLGMEVGRYKNFCVMPGILVIDISSARFEGHGLVIHCWEESKLIYIVLTAANCSINIYIMQ